VNCTKPEVSQRYQPNQLNKPYNRLMFDQSHMLAGNGRWWLICLLGLLSLGLIAAYSEILIWIVKGWFSFERSYSLLILLLSLYMIWNRKDFILQTPAQPSLIFGSLLTAAGCFIVVAGRLSSTLMVQGISLVIVLLGLIWLLLGTKHLKMFFIPIGYLFFMFYLLEEVLGRFSHLFQAATAWIAANMIQFSGMPVAWQGNIIELPHITLEVAKVCNGVNHVVALTAMSVPFAFLTYKSTSKKVLITLSALVFGLCLNGMRVALIAHWTKNHPGGPLHGPFDIFYVSFILIFGFILFALPLALSKLYNKGKSAAAKSTVPLAAAEARKMPRTDSKKQWAALSAALAILALSNAYIYLHKPIPMEPKRDLNEFPLQIGLWTGQDVEDRNWPAKHLNADIELRRIYRHPSGKEVGLYVGYFKTQEQGKELISHQLSWLHLRAEEIAIEQKRHKIKILKGFARGLSGQTYLGDRRAFYFWYQIKDGFYIDPYKAKILLLLNNLLNRRSNGALVIVSEETASNRDTLQQVQSISFLAEIIGVIHAYF
jgi:EpsI family protein